MSLAARIAWDDTILPFQLDRADIRGRVARLDATLETILAQHEYPRPVAALVAEAALLTALIGQTIKLRWKLSLQVRGQGPIRLIATDYFGPSAEGEPARLRAYAGYEAEGIAAAGDADGAFIFLGDMPLVPHAAAARRSLLWAATIIASAGPTPSAATLRR